MKKLNIDKKSLLLAILVSIILFMSTIIYAGRAMGGNYYWLIQSSDRWGVPEEIEQAYGDAFFDTLYDVGWDGQFYYYIANDLLGLKDTAEHIDAPSYRYQRVGLPLIAKFVSIFSLESTVSVRSFVLANILILGAAIYLVAKYFKERDWSRLWILPWAFSAGVVITLRHCLPDGAADALVLMALIAVLKKKDIQYSIFMTLGCLAREGFVLVAFFIFCLKIVEKIRYCNQERRPFDFRVFLCYAFPGIAFVGWYLYVTVHFGAFPFSWAHGIQDWYMIGWARNLVRAFSESNMLQLCGLLLYGATVVYSLYYAVITGKRKRIWWVFVPYIILVSSFGDIVLAHWTGYLKGISILFCLLPMMLADTIDEGGVDARTIESNVMHRTLTLTLAVCSVISGLVGYGIYLQHPLKTGHNTQTIGVVAEPNVPLQNFSCELEVLDLSEKTYASSEWIKLFTEDYMTSTVRLKNTSQEIWHRDRNEDNWLNVRLGYLWYKADDLNTPVSEGRADLPMDMFPGDQTEIEFFVEHPEGLEGDYVLRISLLQEGNAWFYEKQEAEYVDLTYTFRLAG